MPKTKIIRLMDRQMDASRAERKLPKKRRFAPYFLGAPCERKVQYMYSLTEPDYPMSLDCAWHAESGGLHHDWMRKKVHAAFEGTEHKLIDYKTPKGKTLWNPFDKCWNYEFPLVRKKFSIPKAWLDGVAIIDKELWLLEYKTSTKNSFENWLQKPKDDHLQQGMICWQMFNDNLRMGKFSHIKELKPFKEAKGIIFIYVMKDSPRNRKEFTIRGNPSFVELILKKLIRIKKATKAGKLMTIPARKPTNFFCGGCEFRDKCADGYIPKATE